MSVNEVCRQAYRLYSPLLSMSEKLKAILADLPMRSIGAAIALRGNIRRSLSQNGTIRLSITG